MASVDLKSILTCGYCKNIYEYPVILPCKQTICRDDIITLHDPNRSNSFTCPFCFDSHQLPPNGFEDHNELKKFVLEHFETLNLGENYKFAKICRTKIDQMINEYECLKKNPQSFIDNNYAKIREQIENSRNAQHERINRAYDDILENLNQLEEECFNSVSNVINDPLFGDHTSQVRAKLREWTADMLKFDDKKWDIINVEFRKTSDDLEKKISCLKNGLLLNRSVEFEEIPIETNHLKYGNLLAIPKKSAFQPQPIVNPINLTHHEQPSMNTTPKRNSIATTEPKRILTIIDDTEEVMSSKGDSLGSRHLVPPEQNFLANLTNIKDNLFMAMYDFEARSPNELTIRKGDVLYINPEDPNNDRDDEYCFAYMYNQNPSNPPVKNVSTSRRQSLFSNRELLNYKKSCGLIPKSYIDEFESYKHEQWYFGKMNRSEAEMYLKLDYNKIGSYLVRLSEDYFVLSIKDHNNVVKHYRIFKVEEDKRVKYFVEHSKIKFSSLVDLINHYYNKADGLCTQLTEICLKERPFNGGGTTNSIKKLSFQT